MRRRGTHTLRLALLVGSAGLSWTIGGHALAQTNTAPAAAPADAPAAQPAQAIGEVVVTAQRRAQSIQDVGISITAMNEQQIAALGVQSTQDIARHVPNLQFDGGSGGGLNAFVSIRGVSQVDFSEHQEAPNAVYLDDVYVPTPSMVGFPVYDMSRVEALRGPQGTLFGRNSTGGLLQFVTTNPSSTYGGYIDAQYGSFNTWRAEAAGGGPLGDHLSFRVAGFINKGDGWFQNLVPGQKASFQTNEYGVRAKLAADFGDGWKATLTASINNSPPHHEGIYKAVSTYPDAQGVTQFLPANVDYWGTGPGNNAAGYRDPLPNRFDAGYFNNANEYGKGNYLTKSFDYATIKVEGPIRGATFTSITNYSLGNINYSEDSDGSPLQIYNFSSYGNTYQFSQEARLSENIGRLNWTAGVYFLDLRGRYTNLFDTVYFNGTPSAFHQLNPFWQHTQSYAAFGQVEYKFTDTLKLTAGLRYTHDHKDFSSIVYNLDDGSVLLDFQPSTVGKLAEMDHGDFAGKLQLDYQPNRNLLFYAGVSRGIRGGGFNAGVVPIANVPFQNETVYAYEAGNKLIAWDGRLSLHSAIFYYDYHNYQAFNLVGLAAFDSNNPAYYYGGETELVVRPVDDLNISLGASALKARVLNVDAPQGLLNVEPVKAPPLTFNGVVSKVFHLNDYDLTFIYDFDYLAKSRANLFPSPVTTLPASWMHDARVTFGRPADRWEIYGFVKNLTNTARESFAYDNVFVGIGLQSYDPPRTFGVGFRKTF